MRAAALRPEGDRLGMKLGQGLQGRLTPGEDPEGLEVETAEGVSSSSSPPGQLFNEPAQPACPSLRRCRFSRGPGSRPLPRFLHAACRSGSAGPEQINPPESVVSTTRLGGAGSESTSTRSLRTMRATEPRPAVFSAAHLCSQPLVLSA